MSIAMANWRDETPLSTLLIAAVEPEGEDCGLLLPKKM
jgi:hypothetical protein